MQHTCEERKNQIWQLASCPALALHSGLLPHLFVGLQIPLWLSQKAAMTSKYNDKYPLLLSQKSGNFLSSVYYP